MIFLGFRLNKHLALRVMDYEDVLLRKNARELQIKIRMMKDNTFNIYKDRLVEINKILTDNCFRENLKFMTLVNMKKLVENVDSFRERRVNVFYFIYNLNRDIL